MQDSCKKWISSVASSVVTLDLKIILHVIKHIITCFKVFLIYVWYRIMFCCCHYSSVCYTMMYCNGTRMYHVLIMMKHSNFDTFAKPLRWCFAVAGVPAPSVGPINFVIWCLSIWFRPYHITVASWWARQGLKSPASRLFTQTLVQAQINRNIKAPRHWPLWVEITGGRWIPLTKGQ